MMIPCSKRRRPASHGRNSWASLPEDLVELIGQRVLVGDFLDYIRFRAVCSHWKRCTVSPGGRGLVDPRFHPRRWMLLPEGNGLYPGHPNLGGYVRFVNLFTGTFVRVHLPFLDDHEVLDSTDGLLLLHRHCDTAIRLLHPFTGDIAELPPLLSLLRLMEPGKPYHYGCNLRDLRVFLRGVCAAVNVTAAGVITVMLGLGMSMKHIVPYAAAGDQQWSLPAWKLPRLRALTTSFQGKLYAAAVNSADNNVSICQIDPPQLNAEDPHMLSLPPPKMIVKCPVVASVGSTHLVDCGSELMLVGFSDIKSREHPVVYRLSDLLSGRILHTTNIGGHALFLEERGLCVSPNKGFPSIVGNTIICKHRSARLVETCDAQPYGCKSIDQFDLCSGTWSPALEEDILRTNRNPAQPYTISHHIFTCCYRSYWNKGLMLCAAIIPDWSVKPNLRIG